VFAVKTLITSIQETASSLIIQTDFAKQECV